MTGFTLSRGAGLGDFHSAATSRVSHLAALLAIMSADQSEIQRTIEKAVAKRNKARGKKMWSVADDIRTMLKDMGVLVQDTGPRTSEWRWAKGALQDSGAEDGGSSDDDGVVKTSRTKRRKVEVADAVDGSSDDEPPPKKKVHTVGDEVAAPKKKRKTFPGGLVATILAPGNGKTAQNKKKITMKYVGTLASNGREFDRGKISFRLGAGEVIRGWDVGCAGMAVGERRQLFIPAKLGYGRSGAPPDIGPNADLNFDCTLLKA